MWRNVSVSNTEKSLEFFTELCNSVYLWLSDHATPCFVASSTRFQMAIKNTGILLNSVDFDFELTKSL